MLNISKRSVEYAADLIVLDIETTVNASEIVFPGTKDRLLREIIRGLEKLMDDVPVENHCDASEGRCAEDDTCDKNAVKVVTDPLLCTADLMPAAIIKIGLRRISSGQDPV